MKIKIDFVTNSSSSAFIVIFDKIIKSVDDIINSIPDTTKAEQVFRDAQNPIKITDASRQRVIKEMAKRMSYGYIAQTEEERLDYSVFMRYFCEREGITEDQLYKNRSWMNSFYKEKEHYTNKVLLKKAEEFVSQNEGKYFYLFQYADDDGAFMSNMEHGGTFNRLPHITISMH